MSLLLTVADKKHVLKIIRRNYRDKLSELCVLAGYEDVHSVVDDAMDSGLTVPRYLARELAGNKQASRVLQELQELSYIVMTFLWEV